MVVARLGWVCRGVASRVVGGDGRAYPVQDLADDLAALPATPGIARVGVVGFSMGGWVSTRLPLAHPDLVAALAIVDSCARMETPEVAAGYAQIKASLLDFIQRSLGTAASTT